MHGMWRSVGPPPETPEKDFWEELEGTPEGAMLKNDTTVKLA
jgi:hypothetical protein